jgi:hypothetical protein
VDYSGRPGHEGWFQFARQPLLKAGPAQLRLQLTGPVSAVAFSFVDDTSGSKTSVTLTRDPDAVGLDSVYQGEVSIPPSSFFVEATGTTTDNTSFDVSSPTIQPASAGLILPATFVHARPGTTLALPIVLARGNSTQSVRIAVSDSAGILTALSSVPDQIIDQDYVTVTTNITIPVTVPNQSMALLMVTISDQSTGSVLNSSSMRIFVDSAL